MCRPQRPISSYLLDVQVKYRVDTPYSNSCDPEYPMAINQQPGAIKQSLQKVLNPSILVKPVNSLFFVCAYRNWL